MQDVDADERAGYGAAEAAEGVRCEGGSGFGLFHGVRVGRNDGRVTAL